MWANEAEIKVKVVSDSKDEVRVASDTKDEVREASESSIAHSYIEF